jgi:hypothetical protein
VFGYPLDRLLNFVNIGYLIALAATVLFALAIWILSSKSIRAKDELIANANKQSELAKVDAAKANENAANANRDAALAVERAAILEKQAEVARIEHEKLKAQLAWRTLNEDSAQKMESELASDRGSVTIAYTGGDPEALYFGIQIASIFNKAKWQANLEPRTYPDTIYFGIFIPGPDVAQIRVARTAFKAAGLKYSITQVPKPMISFNVHSNEDVLIMIGSRLVPYQGVFK